MSKPVNVFQSAVELYNEVDPTSPYRKIATIAIVAMLDGVELYLLKILNKQKSIGDSRIGGIVQRTVAQSADSKLSRLIALGLIREITIDTDKKRRFDLTPLGHSVNHANELNLDAHLNWYIDSCTESPNVH
jgi:hypothetical protein